MVSNQVLRPSTRKCSVEQGAVQPLDDAVGLRPADPGALVLDAFELQKQLVGMAVLAAAELAVSVAQHRRVPAAEGPS
jgi:hypothetical protein